MSKPKTVPFAKYTELAVKNGELEDTNLKLNEVRRGLEKNLLKECDKCIKCDEESQLLYDKAFNLEREVSSLKDLLGHLHAEELIHSKLVKSLTAKANHLIVNVKAISKELEYEKLPWYSKLYLWFKTKRK